MNHREVAKRVLRIATGAEPTEDQVDRLVDARKDGLRMRFVTVDPHTLYEQSPTKPLRPGDMVAIGDFVFRVEL